MPSKLILVVKYMFMCVYDHTICMKQLIFMYENPSSYYLHITLMNNSNLPIICD